MRKNWNLQNPAVVLGENVSENSKSLSAAEGTHSTSGLLAQNAMLNLFLLLKIIFSPPFPSLPFSFSQNPLLYPSLLSFKFLGSFFKNYYSMLVYVYVRVCVYVYMYMHIYIPNLLNLYGVNYMYISPSLGIPYMPVLLCMGFSSHGLFSCPLWHVYYCCPCSFHV